MSTESEDRLTYRIGAHTMRERGTQFRVWAPEAETVDLVFKGPRFTQAVPMEKEARGYFSIEHSEDLRGERYMFRLNGGPEFPDPASRFQPEGVHGPSEVVSSDFSWTDSNWKGLDLEELVIYELHVGTFSPSGDFEGVQNRLSYFQDLGINALEIMPVAQFPGSRNWGYDGVGLFAVQNSYGGPEAFKKLIEACHRTGIAVFLDVVYNHLGPEGNHLARYGPYFQNKYHTPWGDALNFDGEWSDEIRRFYLENARQWLEEFHLDGLRLDAVHAIFDTSARPFLEELSLWKHDLQNRLQRELHLIAESDANDSRILRPRENCGFGLDAQWADDVHHAIHSLLTGERQGYYADYGEVRQLMSAYRDGVIYDGEYSEFRHKRQGRTYQGIERHRLVVFAQNHDQIGNRKNGDRLIDLVGARKQKLAAACVFLSPYLPLIFMGEEYGEKAPFLYFVDHSDSELVEAVRKGRREEFSGFSWEGEPPDPASPETFLKSKLKWESLDRDSEAKSLLRYYRELIRISKWIRRERLLEPDHIETDRPAGDDIIKVQGVNRNHWVQVFFSFSSVPQKVEVGLKGGQLEFVLESWDDGVLSVSDIPDLVDLKPFTALALGGALNQRQ